MSVGPSRITVMKLVSLFLTFLRCRPTWPRSRVSMMNTIHIKSSSTVSWIPFQLMTLFCNPDFLPPLLSYPKHPETFFKLFLSFQVLLL
ncbi:hypothetical protein DFH94DRAFT_782117 [Russula ochroleuca]|uniref:Uncharacterized protein n=1 Tax=Russula ochroleuca TaxID=152965 RepID=A0A9P5JWJ9_9AGAM|nr:hypothetical protein DFH94DRAFT_782117 [Russula ochroleuca]